MSTPPLPPRPYDNYNSNNNRKGSLPPPVPPLPPDFHVSSYVDDYNGGPYPPPNAPHFAEPLLAPKPTKLMNDVPTNMANNLNDQLTHSPPPPNHYQNIPSYNEPPPMNTMPGFRPLGAQSPYLPPQASQGPSPGQIFPGGYAGNSMSPPMPSGGWARPRPAQNIVYQSPPPSQTVFPPANRPPSVPSGYVQGHQHRSSTSAITQGMSNLSFGQPESAVPQRPGMHGRTASYNPQHSQTLPSEPIRRPSPKGSSDAPPTLTATFPTISSLIASQPQVNSDPSRQVAWARDVFWLVDHSQSNPHASDDTQKPAIGPLKVDSQIHSFVEHAINLIDRLLPQLPLTTPIPVYIAEAIYMRGRLSSTGAFPEFIPLNPREAFRYFEASAKAGYAPGWFQLGRDYESVNDHNRARSCFEKGVKAGVESCCYRMGMAYLLGQLSLPVDIASATSLLQSAAANASMEFPQPAYVWGLLLLNEFPAASIPPAYFASIASPPNEAKRSIERAAYLGFSPAQYKLGHSYEYALPPFPSDPLLSVQYYSLASQQGEEEADMALSKWFLCGSEGAFEKDEGLAYTFAEKAARKGLPTAMFAMGYYAEVGVGRKMDLEVARKWYTRAAEGGNADAVDRLKALNQPKPQMLSRAEHENITDSKLVRKRTQAKNEAIAQGRTAASNGKNGGEQNAELVVGNIRKHSILHKQRRENTGDSTQTSGDGQGRLGIGRGRGRGRVGRAGESGPGPVPGGEQRRPSVPSTTHSPSPGPNGQRRPSPSQSYTSLQDNGPVRPPAEPTQGRTGGPATFAEMGFQSQKLEDKECVIM